MGLLVWDTTGPAVLLSCDVRDQSDPCRYTLFSFIACLGFPASPAFCHHPSEAAAVILTTTIHARLPSFLLCFLITRENLQQNGHITSTFLPTLKGASQTHQISVTVICGMTAEQGWREVLNSLIRWWGEFRCSPIGPQVLALWQFNNNHRGVKTLDICPVVVVRGWTFSDDDRFVLENSAPHQFQSNSSGWEGRGVHGVPHEDGWIGAC